MHDWTRAWTRASALALTAALRRPLLAHPPAARRLERCLEETAGRARLPIIAWLILPDRLHVIGACDTPLAWTLALGRVKQAFTRHAHASGAAPGRLWRTDVRVRPLAAEDLAGAVRALHDLPVREGLCPGPADWAWSSARQPALTGVAVAGQR